MVESSCARIAGAEVGWAGEVLDKHGASKPVFAGKRLVAPYLGGHADVGLFLEPEDVEDAPAVPQPGEECLDGMDKMQELEAV